MTDKTTTQSPTNSTPDIPIVISFAEPAKEKPKLDVCWTNMIASDMIHHFQIFSATLIAWCRLNPTLTLQDLETELRKRNLNTHLIAVKNTGQFETKFTESKYYPIISCRPSNLAQEEVLTHYESYEHNYRKLLKIKTVMLFSADKKNDTDDFKKLNNDTLVNFIADCRVEIRLVTCS